MAEQEMGVYRECISPTGGRVQVWKIPTTTGDEVCLRNAGLIRRAITQEALKRPLSASLPVIPMIAFHWASGSRGMETKPQVFIRLQDHKNATHTFCYAVKADISEVETSSLVSIFKNVTTSNNQS